MGKGTYPARPFDAALGKGKVPRERFEFLVQRGLLTREGAYYRLDLGVDYKAVVTLQIQDASLKRLVTDYSQWLIARGDVQG